MDLVNKIDADIKKAMLARDQVRLNGLRNIKAALLLEKTGEGSGGVISKEAELKVLQKLAKQRKEAAEIYKSQGRPELEKTELDELKVVESFLPPQLEPQELESALKGIVEEIGAVSIKDMGRVMVEANKTFAGQADGKTISETVKRLLS